MAPQETNLYYLQSRYYDPEVGRFLNPDTYAATGQGLLGNNMFAYCLNNPVAYSDSSGQSRDGLLNNEFCSTAMELAFCAGGAGGGAIIGALLLDPTVITEIVDVVEDGLNVMIRAVDHLITVAQHEIELLKKSIQPDYQYWEAYRIKNVVYIGRGLTIVEASVRVSCGFDVMCANESAARWLLVLNGYWNHTNAEIHGDTGYYWHYYPHRNSHTHIWFC